MNDDLPTGFALRARWLSDISASLAEAEDLLRALDEYQSGASEVEVVKARIEKLSREVDALRFGPTRMPDDAKWAGIAHWRANRD